MRNDLSLLSTSDLEKAAKHPRGPEDARRIAEELADRRALYSSGGGTLPLFKEGENAERPTPNVQCPTGTAESASTLQRSNASTIP